MTFDSGAGKEFLGFFLDPELLNEEETKICLGDAGVNLESVDQKFEYFQKNIDELHFKALNSVKDETALDKNKCSGKLCTV